MKKTRVFFWINAHQKERLEDLSRRNRVLLSDYLHEAIEDLLSRHEGTTQENVEKEDTDTPKAGCQNSDGGLKQVGAIGGK